jgi:hypothetical protein
MAVPHWSEIETISDTLQSLEDLARLAEDYGLVEIKPFRDWQVSPYRNKIFKMRLCNAGEILEIASYCDTQPQSARVQATKLELMIRSVWSIDGKQLLAEEELAKYNADHKSSMTVLDYMRLWSRNLEQIVVDRLEAIYDGLQQKQLRRIQGMYLCEACTTQFYDLPEGTKKLKYSLGEIICPTCLASMTPDIQSTYDFNESTDVRPRPASRPAQKQPPVMEEESSFGGNGYKCGCGEEFDSLEAFTTHRETCTKAIPVSA